MGQLSPNMLDQLNRGLQSLRMVAQQEKDRRLHPGGEKTNTVETLNPAPTATRSEPFTENTSKSGATSTIPRWAALTEEGKRIEEAVIGQVSADPDLFLERHRRMPESFEGRYGSADLFKETFDEYRAGEVAPELRAERTTAVHNSSSRLADRWFRARLAADDPGRNEVAFLTAAPGSGKTSFIKLGDAPGTKLIFETFMADLSYARMRVQQVLDSGNKPTIFNIYAHPIIALERAALRGAREGRVVTAERIASIHSGLPNTLRALKEEFGDRLVIEIVDNTADEPVVRGLRFLDRIPDTENRNALWEKLRTRLNELHAARTIPEWIVHGFDPQ